MAEKMIKVKFMKWVGEYQPGQVVELPEELAKQMCEVKEVHDGHKLIPHQKAMLLSEVEKLKKMPVDINKMTQKEMNELGLKNIVHSPKTDKEYEAAYLESIGVKKGKLESKSKGKDKDKEQDADQEQDQDQDQEANKDKEKGE